MSDVEKSIAFEYASQSLDEALEYVNSVFKPKSDQVNKPGHYLGHPSGIECIEVTEHMDFCLGNAIKYIWRAGLKPSSYFKTDLEKAIWYINRYIHKKEIEVLNKKGV